MLNECFSIHTQLKYIIYAYGKWGDKEKGSFIKLPLSPNQFLELDTWKDQIVLKEGDGKYIDIFTGFNGHTVFDLGCYFGKYYTTENINENFINNIQNTLQLVNQQYKNILSEG